MARRSAENAIDWDAIERQYRLGQKTAQQLGSEFGVAVSSITRRSKKLGWVVDKSHEVAATANSLLIQNASGNANPNATPTQLEIKAAGVAVADVVLGHRKGLGRLAALRDRLIHEMEIITDNPDVFDQLGDLLRSEDRNGQDKRNDLYRRVISLPDRIDGTKKLAEIDERVRKGEREAFNVDKGEEQSTPVDDLLHKIAKERGLVS